MKNESEHPLFFDYKGEADEYTHAYWDYAIPSGDGRLLCCYENYRLIQVKQSCKIINPDFYKSQPVAAIVLKTNGIIITVFSCQRHAAGNPFPSSFFQKITALFQTDPEFRTGQKAFVFHHKTHRQIMATFCDRYRNMHPAAESAHTVQ